MVKKRSGKNDPSVARSKTVLVRVFAVDWEKLKKIMKSKGFHSYAGTVYYVLQKFPEMIPVEAPKKIAPVIDAEKARAAAFRAKDKERERVLEPIKNKLYFAGRF